MPVGSGKTVMYAHLIPRLLARGDVEEASLSFLTVSHVERAQHAFTIIKKACPKYKVGLEQGTSVASGGADVTIATCRSIRQESRLVKYDPSRFKAVIVDEAQVAVSDSHRIVLSHFNSSIKSFKFGTVSTSPVQSSNIPIIGFSPSFSDSNNIAFSAFQTVVYHIDIMDMLESGWFAPTRFTTVKADLRLSDASVSRSTDDFNVTLLGEVMNSRGLNDLVLRVYRERANDRRSTLIFCVDLAHVAALVATFSRSGINARTVTGNTKRSERKLSEESFMKGKFPVLVSCEVYVRRTVLPNIDCIIVARPTRSRSLFTRMIGQGLPRSPGKDFCRIIDLVDSANKIDGLITVADLFGLPANTEIDDETPRFLRTFREYQNRESEPGDEKARPDVRVEKVRYVETDDPFHREEQSVGCSWIACGRDRYVLDNGDMPFLAIVKHHGTYLVMRTACLTDVGQYLSLHAKGVISVTESLLEAGFTAEAEAFSNGTIGLGSRYNLIRFGEWKPRDASPKELEQYTRIEVQPSSPPLVDITIDAVADPRSS